jgi:hypothetical protein
MVLTTRLPPELVLRVFDSVDPATLVDLACSCKFLKRCSRDLLRKHRALHARYHIVTDVAPQTLTDVLRKSLADHHLAWHVRELEFTCSRTQWSHWEGANGTEGVDSLPPSDYAFTQDEQFNLLNQLREIFNFDEEQIEKAHTDLQHGNDAPLKLLLFGACPKIRSVKFARNVHLRGKCTVESSMTEKSRSSLEYFHQAILNQLRTRSTAWPAGLNSLQDLAIGVGTEDEPFFHPSPRLFADCMHLPHINSLYCFGLWIEWVNIDEQDDDRGDWYEIAKGSSSIQHMFLDGAYGDYPPMRKIISGCKQLKSLTIAGSRLNDVDAVVEAAGRCYQQSLETLMIYETEDLVEYRCRTFTPGAMERLTSLRTIYVDASDVMLDALGDRDPDTECDCGCDEHEWISDHEEFIEFFMEAAFPESMEVLILGTQGLSELSEGDANLLDQGITTMIEFGRAAECGNEEEDQAAGNAVKPAAVFERCFPNLKAIYLSSLDEKDYRNYPPGRRKRWFSNAIAAGRKFGVDVHTRSTRGRPFHQVDFPKPPTWTSHNSAEEDLVFDVYTGKWEAPKCGNCGTCEDCLDQYDASVWKEVEVEDELDGGRS